MKNPASIAFKLCRDHDPLTDVFFQVIVRFEGKAVGAFGDGKAFVDYPCPVR